MEFRLLLPEFGCIPICGVAVKLTRADTVGMGGRIISFPTEANDVGDVTGVSVLALHNRAEVVFPTGMWEALLMLALFCRQASALPEAVPPTPPIRPIPVVTCKSSKNMASLSIPPT